MIQIKDLTYRYQDKTAIEKLSLEIKENEIFALLGPNGSGKSTLLRILSTILSPQAGHISVSGLNLKTQEAGVRAMIGVVFQTPSLDDELTVYENLKCQGLLYGLSGSSLKNKIDRSLRQLNITSRSGDLVKTLSGGLKRRVEIAKGLLHAPKILFLDEPSTGLDPAARVDLWNHLTALKKEEKITIVFSTHLMDEADHATRVAIMNKGDLLAVDSPSGLKQSVGGDILTIESNQIKALSEIIEEKYSLTGYFVRGKLQIKHKEANRLMKELSADFAEKIESMTFRKATLEDVFIEKTGRALLSGKNSDE